MTRRSSNLTEAVESVATILSNRLESPNECDSNGENANIVDGLFAIARALKAVAKAIEGQGRP